METRKTRSTLSTWVAIASITGVVIAILGFTFDVFKWNKEAAEQKTAASTVQHIQNNTYNISVLYESDGKVKETAEELDETYTKHADQDTTLEKVLMISGSIGAKQKYPYQMRLFHAKDKTVKGYYFYTKTKQPILLEGEYNNGQYSIHSFGKFPVDKEYMDFRIVSDVINGEWKNGQKEHPITGFVNNSTKEISAR